MRRRIRSLIPALATCAVLAEGVAAQEPSEPVESAESAEAVESLEASESAEALEALESREALESLMPPQAEPAERKSPGTALTLALVPGLLSVHGVGQWYNGEIGEGFLFFGAGLIGGSMLLSDPGPDESDGEASTRAALGGLLWLGSLTWSSIDAYRTARRINRERGLTLLGRKVEVALGPALGGSVGVGGGAGLRVRMAVEF